MLNFAYEEIIKIKNKYDAGYLGHYSTSIHWSHQQAFPIACDYPFEKVLRGG
jgi:hypothetical protein